MLTDEEYSQIRQEIGEAVITVLEEGKIVSVETIITQLEKKHQKVVHLHHKDRFWKAIDLLIGKS
ncbi:MULTISPECIES: hypothetical protein [Rahnella]|uniref:hypothetical protein n=1 Tax=Rahnella TaxID=34037 RepID=UPI001330756E|nr:hypothetical protein [Rahnella variigena]